MYQQDIAKYADEKKDINRRNVLKGIGAAGMFGLGSSLSVSVAAADGSTANPVTIFEGSEKLSTARSIAQTEQFDRLLSEASEMGYSFEWDIANLDAGEVVAENLNRQVVAYELNGTTENVRAGIIIGRGLSTNTVEFAQLDVEYYHNDGLFQKVERYELPTSSPSVSLDSMSAGGIEKRVIEPDPDAVRSLVDELGSQQGNVTTQGLIPDLPDLPDVLNISSCSGCYYASKLICRTVCGAFGGFVCGLLGISVVGAIGCVTFVKAVCYVAEKASGCGNDLAATICKSSGLGVCGPNESGQIINIDIPYL